MKLKSKFLSIFAVFALSMAATSAWADEVELSQEDEYRYSATMPQEGENTITVPADAKIIRIGTNNNWLTNSSVTLVAPEGKILQVIEGDYGSLSTEYYNGFSGQDSLFIYNGANASAPEIFKAARGAALGTLSTTGPNLTIYYKESKEKGGWYNNFRLDLIVFVVDPNATHNIVVDEDASSNGSVMVQSSAKANALVQVKATPNAGYVLEGFVIRTTDEWYSIATTENALFAGNEASFIMPGTNVTVEPIFVSAAALESGLTLNTPSGRALRVNIPSGVESFKINGGGMDNELTKPMILKAPDGYLFYLEDGSAQCSNRTGIFAYDGDNEDAYRTIKEPMKGNYSVGSELTLVYVSIGDQYSQTIRLIEANATHSVDVSYDGNGFAGGGLSSASVGNTIDLTAEPGEGYMIGSIYAEADGWWPVPITGGTWYTSNDYSFTMPYADVEVYVEFVKKITTADEGLSIEMPQRDSVVATIPADVESFNVTGKCDWETCRGTLVLAAPEGLRFQLSGSVGIGGEYASVTIFDGSIANALHQLDLNQDLNIELNSSGDTLTLRNQARNSFVGINLLVTMFNPNKKYNVMILDEIENGFISADLTEAAPGDTVTLTATPDEGYLLDSFYVGRQDDFSQIPYIGGRWYNNTAKFVMPAADVNVAAWFAEPDDGDFLTFIPTADTLSLDIPSGMPYLEVRTEVDNNWKYYNNSDGVLELTAPEGYVIEVFGYNSVADNGDVLTIYDGIGETAKKLLEHSDGVIGEMYSTGRSMTIRFKSNASGVDDGLKLYVTILKKTEMPAIAMTEYADGLTEVTIDGDYAGKETVKVPDAVEIDWIEYIRKFTPDVPSTIVLPFSLPANATTNAKFYYLKQVVQVDSKWKATFRNIKLDDEDALPAANTPYAVIVPEASYLQFSLNGGRATFRAGDKAEQTDATGKWVFKGTYEYKTWESDADGIGLDYAIAKEDGANYKAGDYVKVGEGSSAAPMRAYMSKINSSVRLSRPLAWGETSYINSTELPESIDVEFVDEEEKPMAIGRMNTVTGEFKIDRWYDLKGRSTNKKPSTKGAFYNKRVIAK